MNHRNITKIPVVNLWVTVSFQSGNSSEKVTGSFRKTHNEFVVMAYAEMQLLSLL